jgi:hypothetical protein
MKPKITITGNSQYRFVYLGELRVGILSKMWHRPTGLGTKGHYRWVGNIAGHDVSGSTLRFVRQQITKIAGDMP